MTATGRLALRHRAILREGDYRRVVPEARSGEGPEPAPTRRLGPVVYDSSSEVPPFGSWTIVCSSRRFSERLKVVRLGEQEGGDFCFSIEASADERVGVNKSLNLLAGVVNFEYQVIRSESAVSNVYFYMIPMQETGSGRSGLIEVGADRQNDPRNHNSPYRVRKFANPSRFGDGRWHRESLGFDFRDIPKAFYSIFGPRINEGTGYVGAAKLLIKNVVVSSS